MVNAPRTAAPSDRPTEWTTAIVGIVTAVVMFTTNHDTAGFVSAIGGFVPGLITLLVETFGKPAG
jgi:hypothetical protein